MTAVVDTPARILVAHMPRLQGVDPNPANRWRLYTVDLLPWGALPHVEDGGPHLVTATEWGTSTSTTETRDHGWQLVHTDVVHTDGLHTVHVGRITSRAKVERHWLDGAKFPTKRAADRALYEAGLTARVVYERDAARYGLPHSL